MVAGYVCYTLAKNKTPVIILKWVSAFYITHEVVLEFKIQLIL